MNHLNLKPKGKTLEVLCLGAHSDDIEIGCGGTILELMRRGEAVVFDWVIFSASGKRKKEAEASAAAFLPEAALRSVIIESFRDGYFPFDGARIKDVFEALKGKVDPDLIFTHGRSDRHQDHRLVSDLTWNTFRDHAILEYEIAKYDADLGSPNVYVPLDEATVERKIRHVTAHFKSQAGNRWFTDDAFRAILRLRGVESNAPSGFAEAFHAPKLCLF